MPTPMQMLASLLSQKYPNAGVDINQPVITPPSIPNTPWTYPGTPWGSPPTIVNPPGPVPNGSNSPAGQGGSGRGDTTAGQVEGEGYGKMSPGMRAAFGLGGSLASAAFGPPGWAAAMFGLTSDYLAGPYRNNPLSGVMTPEGIQNTYDFEGNIKGDAAKAERAAAEAARAASIGPGIMGDPATPGPTDAPIGPSPESQSYEGGYSAPDSTGEGPGGGPSGEGTASGESGGHGAAGDSSMNALGGVRRATLGPKTATFGEPLPNGNANPETAIFIPDFMAKMGLQGREKEVIQALQTMLQILKGNQSSNEMDDLDEGGEDVVPEMAQPATAKPTITKKEKANGGRRN